METSIGDEKGNIRLHYKDTISQFKMLFLDF